MSMPACFRMLHLFGVALDLNWLGGSGGQVIHQKFPDIFVQSGIMERGNFSAAAGFGMAKDRQVRPARWRRPRP